MDFVKHAMRERSERFYLQFSKISTIAWAIALIVVAYLSRQVPFVLNAAFQLRGLTSGALVGGLALAVFWRKGRSSSVITGMLTAFAVMLAVDRLPRMEWSKAFWMRTVGTEIHWPWYTLIGAVLTVFVAWLVTRVTGVPPANPTQTQFQVSIGKSEREVSKLTSE
jgi:Na+(H+)/acetate symporter ActP